MVESIFIQLLGRRNFKIDLNLYRSMIGNSLKKGKNASKGGD